MDFHNKNVDIFFPKNKAPVKNDIMLIKYNNTVLNLSLVILK